MRWNTLKYLKELESLVTDALVLLALFELAVLLVSLVPQNYLTN